MKVLYLFLLFLFFLCQAIQAKPKSIKSAFTCKAVALDVSSKEVKKLPKLLQIPFTKQTNNHQFGLLRCVSKESICYFISPLAPPSCIKR